MPDTKFSFAALREHLRKFLWIYLVGIAVCLLGTNLLWTTTRPRIPTEQDVVVYLADGYSDYEPLADIARDALERTRAFDDSLLSVEFQSLQYNDQDYTGNILLMTRLAVGEADAFFACQSAMDQLITADVLVPLDDYVAAGWLDGYGLEPYYATLEDEETGERTTYLAGLRLDPVESLARMGAFNNQGAYLCITGNGGNVETTMKAMEYLIEDLMEANDAYSDATEPAA